MMSLTVRLCTQVSGLGPHGLLVSLQSQNQSSEGTDKVDWQLGKSITESISAAQVGEKWSDISFRCSDQDEKDEAIKAHKFILASRSPVFEAMFFGAMKETNDEIKLDDITAETFQLFLR